MDHFRRKSAGVYLEQMQHFRVELLFQVLSLSIQLTALVVWIQELVIMTLWRQMTTDHVITHVSDVMTQLLVTMEVL